MVLFDSQIDAAQHLSDEEKGVYYTALIEFVRYGREPSIDPAMYPTAYALFIGFRPNLDKSKARAEAGRKGGSRPKSKQGSSKDKNDDEQNESKTQANGKQNESKNNVCLPQSEQAMGMGMGMGMGMDTSLYETRDVYDSQNVIRPKDQPVFIPPTAEEVELFAKASCMPKFDANGFVDHYSSQGWVMGNGRPMVDWHAAARKWSVRQREIDARDGRPTRDERDAQIDSLKADYGVDYQKMSVWE